MLISRGPREKKNINDSLIKRKRTDIKKFCEEYHNFTNATTQGVRKQLFTLLKMELLKGLDREEKLLLINDIVPIKGLEDLHNQLSNILNFNEPSYQANTNSTLSPNQLNVSEVSPENIVYLDQNQLQYDGRYMYNYDLMNEMVVHENFQIKNVSPMHSTNGSDVLSRSTVPKNIQLSKSIECDEVSVSDESAEEKEDISELSHNNNVQHETNFKEMQNTQIYEQISQNLKSDNILNIIKDLENTNSEKLKESFNYSTKNEDPILIKLLNEYSSVKSRVIGETIGYVIDAKLVRLSMKYVGKQTIFYWLLNIGQYDNILNLMQIINTKWHPKCKQICLTDEQFKIRLSGLLQSKNRDADGETLRKINDIFLR